jgi:hypothetical protein
MTTQTTGKITNTVLRYGLAGMIGFGTLLLDLPSGSGLSVGTAEARIGRPLTPMSYAGVARRTTRRAVYAGAAVGAAYGGYGYGYAAPPVYAAPVYAPACGQTVDAYGRVYSTC